MNTRIYAAQSPMDAEIVISMLRIHGLNQANLEWSPHISLAGGDLCYYVSSPPEEVERATVILKSKGFVQGMIQARKDG